jgi:hypothetical protein
MKAVGARIAPLEQFRSTQRTVVQQSIRSLGEAMAVGGLAEGRRSVLEA